MKCDTHKNGLKFRTCVYKKESEIILGGAWSVFVIRTKACDFFLILSSLEIQIEGYDHITTYDVPKVLKKSESEVEIVMIHIPS